jgi:hypothetical protein
MKIAIEGLGTVGARVARELISTGDIEVSVVGAETERFKAVAEALGGELRIGTRNDDVDRVILCGAAGAHVDAARAWLAHGVDVISMSSDVADVEGLLGFDELARLNDATVAVGVAAAPGLSCTLARHAADLLDEVTEVHVASLGSGGPACLRNRQNQLGERSREWRDGDWVEHPGGSGKELCWFPDPIGGHDCARGNLVEPLLMQRAFPGMERASARASVGDSGPRLGFLPGRGRSPVEAAPGGVRVEVRGRAKGETITVVYSVHDRLSVAAAATAATLAVQWEEHGADLGAHGMAEFVRPVVLLRELARRGVKAATLDERI